MHKAADALRTIGEVSRLVGVPPHVLRYWETQFTQLAPVKRPDGRRYYRPDDLFLAAGLVELLREDGMTTRGAQKQLARDKGALLRTRGRARLADVLGNAAKPTPAADLNDAPVRDDSPPAPALDWIDPANSGIGAAVETALREDGPLFHPAGPNGAAADDAASGKSPESPGAGDAHWSAHRPAPELDLFPVTDAGPDPVADTARPLPDSAAHRLERLQAAARQLRGQPMPVAAWRAVEPAISALRD